MQLSDLQIDQLYASLGSSSGISKKEFAERIARALATFRRVLNEDRDDDAAEPLLRKLHQIAGHAAKIKQIASGLELPTQTKFYGLRLVSIPNEALSHLCRSASLFLDEIGQPASPRWARRKREGAVNGLIRELSQLWAQAAELDVTFTTNPVTNEVSGKFLAFFLEATRGMAHVPTDGATIKSRFYRLNPKSHRGEKNL